MDSANIEQGSEAWVHVRLGKVTASRVADVIAKTKTGWGASRKNYMAELIAERLTGRPVEKYTNAAMAFGLETEPQARAAYEFFRDAAVREVGFVEHPIIAMSGASPDGLVGDDGLVEIKAPNTATHIETLLSRNIPGKYITQMQWQISCTERQWVDYVSFDPRLPADLQLFVKRVERDDKQIAELGDMVTQFLKELDDTLAALDQLSGPNILDAG